MPKIGLRSAWFNTHNADDTKPTALVDDKVPVLGRIIDETASINKNSVELYADDVLAESDYTFSDGTLSITVADDDDDVAAKLLGCTVEPGGSISQSIYDTAPEIVYGHVVTKQKKGVKSWKVEFFPRCKVKSISADAKTRGKNVEFTTTKIEMSIMALGKEFNGLPEGKWEVHETFTTRADAEAYLKTLCSPIADPDPDPENGGAGG